jgi:hypothetical protein
VFYRIYSVTKARIAGCHSKEVGVRVRVRVRVSVRVRVKVRVRSGVRVRVRVKPSSTFLTTFLNEDASNIFQSHYSLKLLFYNHVIL